MKILYWWSSCPMKTYVRLGVLGGFLMVITFPGCTGNKYQQDVNVIKGHVKTFYDRLQSHRITQAMAENEQIEVIALRAEERLLRRVGQMTQGERIQEWKIIKTAKETAAENWLALARYFLETQQYNKALDIYRRIIETYQAPPYHSYANRAKTGLRNVETILESSLPVFPQE